jgi:hypothetical protein
MANFCLPPKAVDGFKKAVMSGKIDPYKLKEMSSDERRAIFEDVVGKEGAKQVNAEFEAKTLLKNQKFAYTAWAKKVAGITPDTRRDLVAQISKLDKVLSPADEKSFLKDLASTKLGVNVTDKEAKNIADLSSKVSDAENGARTTQDKFFANKKFSGHFTPSKADMNYGYARYDLEKYVGDLKGRPGKFQFGDLKTPGGLIKAPVRLVAGVFNVTKSLGASLDDSFALRHANSAFFTDFPRWQKSFRQSFVNIAKAAKDPEEAQRELSARLMAHPLYDDALKSGVSIRGVKSVDDILPTSAPEKVPVVGRAFKMTQIGYAGMADELRLNMYAHAISLAKDVGEDVPISQKKNLATMINSLTGRGSFGRLEPVAKHLNALFYSARLVKSQWDVLIGHPLGSGVGGTFDYAIGKEGAVKFSSTQRKAAINLIKISAGYASILATAEAMKPGSVDFNPLSSNFGKIKVDNTWFDITGGKGPMVVLAARLAERKTKSEAGKITKLNSGAYGSETTMDTLVNFISGKTSPVGSVGVDYLNGQTFNGSKVTLKGEATNTLTPLDVQDYEALKAGKGSPNAVATILLDAIGVTGTTEVPSKTKPLDLSGQNATTLTKAAYAPATLSKTQIGNKLNPAQYTKLENLTATNFAQAVAQARASSTFRGYTQAEQKKSLSQSLSAAKAKALQSMNIHKKTVTSPRVNTY